MNLRLNNDYTRLSVAGTRISLDEAESARLVDIAKFLKQQAGPGQFDLAVDPKDLLQKLDSLSKDLLANGEIDLQSLELLNTLMKRVSVMDAAFQEGNTSFLETLLIENLRTPPSLCISDVAFHSREVAQWISDRSDALHEVLDLGDEAVDDAIMLRAALSNPGIEKLVLSRNYWRQLLYVLENIELTTEENGETVYRSNLGRDLEILQDGDETIFQGDLNYLVKSFKEYDPVLSEKLRMLWVLTTIRIEGAGIDEETGDRDCIFVGKDSYRWLYWILLKKKLHHELDKEEDEIMLRALDVIGEGAVLELSDYPEHWSDTSEFNFDLSDENDFDWKKS